MYRGHYWITEWDGTRNLVWLSHMSSCTYSILYKDGVRHEVSDIHIKELRPVLASNSDVNVR